MEKSEEAAGAVAAAAPVVRQLDFTVNILAMANSSGKGNSLLPECPQAHLQSKWLALGESRQVHAPERTQSPPQPLAQTKLPPRKLVMPPKSPHRELPQMAGQTKLPAKTPRLALPVVKPVSMPKPALQPSMKMESPKSRERCNLEPNDGTPKKQKQCKCRNSRCLKLYCECFASGVYCDGCNCINCHNKIEYEADRKESIEAILERKPDAFRPKIASSPNGAADGGVEHNKGCNCKKSGCLKRYCECFQANILCSDKCKCIDCKNFEGSEERKVHFHQHAANSLVFIQQAANAAINEAIGIPSNKNVHQQIGFEVASNRPLTSWGPQFHQETHMTYDSSYSPSSSGQLSKPDAAVLGPSKVSYRSPLAGVLQLQHVKDFCELLVEVSTEAAKNVSEASNLINNRMDVKKAEITVSPYDEDSKDHQNKQNPDGNRGNIDRASLCESDGDAIHNGRPLSPGTLALMCDERDASFMEANTPPAAIESSTRMQLKLASATTNGTNQLYVEQERLVLTQLRCFLNKIITCGSIEEMKVEQENS